jgi:hypothetical protein
VSDEIEYEYRVVTEHRQFDPFECPMPSLEEAEKFAAFEREEYPSAVVRVERRVPSPWEPLP